MSKMNFKEDLMVRWFMVSVRDRRRMSIVAKHRLSGGPRVLSCMSREEKQKAMGTDSTQV